MRHNWLLQLTGLEQAVSVIRQVAYTLAVAECSCNFEHRDLHWGNVLVKSCGACTEVKGKINGQPYTLASAGVRVSVIDFTLSRLNHTGMWPTHYVQLSHVDATVQLVHFIVALLTDMFFVCVYREWSNNRYVLRPVT